MLGLLQGELRLQEVELLLEEGEAACEPRREARPFRLVPLLRRLQGLLRPAHPLEEGRKPAEAGLQAHPEGGGGAVQLGREGGDLVLQGVNVLAGGEALVQ